MRYTWKMLGRRPLQFLAAAIFSAVVSAALCGIYAFGLAEQAHYESVYDTIPVTLTVTNLTGTRSDELEAPWWVADVFTVDQYRSGYADYVTDCRIQSKLYVYYINREKALCGVAGINDAQMLRDRLLESGGSVYLLPGYADAFFREDVPCCLVSERLFRELSIQEEPMIQRTSRPAAAAIDCEPDVGPPGALELGFRYQVTEKQGEEAVVKNRYETLSIAGTFSGTAEAEIYCPYAYSARLGSEIGQEDALDSVSAKLAANDDLEEMKGMRARWFAEPSVDGLAQQWGKNGYESYPYALDIDDSALRGVAAVLENEMRINRIATLLIFVLSAAAGFLASFLMIRSRKREIVLMRTLGTAALSIFGGFFAEQLLAVGSGIALGGAAFFWKPLWQLGVFAGVYMMGLSLSLLIFLRSNLMDTIKEEE